LKAGIKDPREEARSRRLTDLELLQRKMEKLDPVFEHFKYPGLESSVARVMSGGIQHRVNAGKKMLGHKGRKFAYSTDDFLEAYLGKDFAA